MPVNEEVSRFTDELDKIRKIFCKQCLINKKSGEIKIEHSNILISPFEDGSLLQGSVLLF